MGHPYSELLKDRPLRLLWGGLTLSAIGSEFYRVGAIWLAVKIAGANSALMITAQAGAMLAVSLLAGPVIETLPRRAFLIWGEILSALVAGGIVLAGLAHGLSFAHLVAAGVTLGAISAMSRPVFLSSLPTLVPGKVREANGLFDSSMRIAQAGGPFLVSLALKAVPPIHLLTVNAVTFLASAASLAWLRRPLDGAGPGPVGAASVLRRLGRGLIAANGVPGVRSVLVATGVRGGAYALGYGVALPLLFAGAHAGLPGLAVVLGVGATTETLSTPLLVLTQPRRPLRRLFEGYMIIGLSLAAMGLAAALLAGAPSIWLVAVLSATAAMIGFGNSVATLQLTSFLASRLDGDDYAAVLRLRYVVIIGSMMLATAAGPALLSRLGPAWTILLCGLAALAAAGPALLARTTAMYGPGFTVR
ncbi:MAG: MFS transporter [Caulobacterales bacterium]|nr:MFS transporter [Caulobacterales bacterium]